MEDWSASGTTLVAFLVFVGCAIGAAAGTKFVFPIVGAAILFPPYAVLTAALVLAPMRRWWVVVLAASMGSCLVHREVEQSWSFVLLAEVANVIRALVAAGGIRLVSGTLRLDTLRDTAAFLAFAVVLGPVTGAFVGAADVVLHDRAPGYWLPWQAWLLSNALTGLTLLPLLVYVVKSPATFVGRTTPRRAIEAVTLSVGLLLVGFLVLARPRAATSLPASLYGPLPFMLWAAVRFGPGGTIAALSAITALAIHGATSGRGPFILQSPEENLVQLQFFLIALYVPMVFLSAIVREHGRAAAALRQSQARYRSVVEDQTELICRILPDGTYTFVNEAYCRYFQRSPENLLGQSFWQFLPAEAHEECRQLLASIDPANPVATIEHKVIMPGGGIGWQQWTNRGFFDGKGRILEYQSVGRDITGRKRAEESVKQSEDQLRMFVEHTPAAVAMLDRDMRYIVHSRRWLSDHKLGEQDLVGRCHDEVFPEIPEHWKQAYRRCLAGAIEMCAEDLFHRLDGTTDWIHWEVRPWHNGDGSIGGIIIFTEVVTARKRAEEEHRQLEAQRQIEAVLRQSEERFHMLADSAPVLIWMSGLRNEAVYFNKPWLEFTGRSLEQELEFGWVAAIHPEDRQRCTETCEAAFKLRGRVSMQFRLRRHDGEYRWVLDNGIPHFGTDGAFTGYIGSCVDITERHLAEEALQQAGRRKDEFLAMLGHELRNPLAPISMAVEIMRRRAPTDDSVVWAVDVIARQLGHLTRLVDDLLDISRVTRGKIRLNKTPIDLRRVITQAVEASRPLIVARNHELSIDVPESPLPIQGDGVRLAQVITNLLNNAAKYTDVGGHIAVKAEQVAALVVLRVVDDGVGISEHMLERVFDMFTQIDSSYDRSHGGLGVGLTLVKRLVEMHDGTIEARSGGPGRGSEFIVQFPLVPGLQALDEDGGSRTPIEEKRDGTSQLGWEHKRVLIVDDNVDAAECLSRLLRLQEHDVLVVHDGLAALSAAETMHPDIVLLDIGLPKLDGLEVARRLRKGGGGSHPLLVATTGFDQAEDRRRIADAGFDHHLIKPLDPNVVQCLVQTGRLL
jgi:PAS domain S-box-containing protein